MIRLWARQVDIAVAGHMGISDDDDLDLSIVEQSLA